MALFVCVLLHEYGHALSARRYGVQTRDIVLMPIGGVARLERMPEKPMQEFIVAIAGPMVNVGIAIILMLLIWIFADPVHLELLRTALMQKDGEEAIEEAGIQIPQLLQFAVNLTATNIALVLFNMIPAFPMDGGRVFRALLSMRTGRPRPRVLPPWSDNPSRSCSWLTDSGTTLLCSLFWEYLSSMLPAVRTRWCKWRIS